MSIFTSQFDRARRISQAYASQTGETRFWTPAKVALAGAGAGAAALVATDLVAADDDAPSEVAGWGEGWDTGWDGGGNDVSATGEDTDLHGADDGADGGAWSYHSDTTDASIGGDGDFFYFTDGDTSYTSG
jgi:hypothetical protein